MSDNYIVINGKRVELTDEQVAAIGIEKKNPFERVASNDYYYYVRSDNHVDVYTDADDMVDKTMYDVSNYFTDIAFANQVALHQLLYRKLLKFAYDNGCEDTARWNGVDKHYCIAYNTEFDKVDVTYCFDTKFSVVYFSSEEATKRAIREVIRPFMKEHPDFVW